MTPRLFMLLAAFLESHGVDRSGSARDGFVLCPGRRFKGRLSIQRCATLRAELSRSFLEDLQFIVPETNHHGNDISPSVITNPAMWPTDTQQKAMPVPAMPIPRAPIWSPSVMVYRIRYHWHAIGVQGLINLIGHCRHHLMEAQTAASLRG